MSNFFESGSAHAGVCLHISSLPGRWGIGDIGGSAFRFIDWLSDAGLSIWQFLPTGPTGHGDSPYQPLSTFAGNPLFIDPDHLAGLELLDSSGLRSSPEFPAGRVDYARVGAIKGELLDLAARRLLQDTGHPLAEPYAEFKAANDAAWLRDYALFQVLRRQQGTVAWLDWSAPFARRQAQALAALERECALQIELGKAEQFLFHLQWQRLRDYARQKDVALFGDLPIYLALDCAEAWARPDLLQFDESGRPSQVGGVPPDYFSEYGQLWGNPLYDWTAHAAEGYAWWLRRFAQAFALSDIVRLDHFRGFEAYWSIPAHAASAREGCWLPGPGRDLFDQLVAAQGPVPIVAEDLGMITEEVRSLRRHYGWPGMQVLQFLVDQDEFDANRIGEDCVCYTGTHDNDTTIGWFHGSRGRVAEQPLRSMQEKILKNTQGEPETIHQDMLRLAFGSRARVAIAPMQDFLGLDSGARLNTPGTTFGNWQWRLHEEQLDSASLNYLAPLLRETGRSRR